MGPPQGIPNFGRTPHHLVSGNCYTATSTEMEQNMENGLETVIIGMNIGISQQRFHLGSLRGAGTLWHCKVPLHRRRLEFRDAKAIS